MKTFFILLTPLLFLEACSDSSHSPESQKDASVPAASSPTEIGNGIDHSAETQNPSISATALVYQNPKFGIEIPYGPEWKVEEKKEGVIVFVNPTTTDYLELKITTNLVRSNEQILKAYQEKFKTSVAIEKIGEFEGFVFENQIVLANEDIVIEIKTSSSPVALTLLQQLKYLSPSCTQFKIGQWVRYEVESEDKNKNIITHKVKNVDVATRRVFIASKSENVIYNSERWIPCNQLEKQFLENQNLQLSEKLHVELNSEVSLGAASVKTIRMTEKISSLFAPHISFTLVTHFSESVPLFGIVKLELKNNKNKTIETWTLMHYGLDENETAHKTLSFVYAISPAEKIVMEELKNLSPLVKLQQAYDFLSYSRILYAWELYNDLIENEEEFRKLSFSQQQQAYFGRALTTFLIFLDQPEYQAHLQKMNFFSYYSSIHFFGPDGFLAHYSQSTAANIVQLSLCKFLPFGDPFCEKNFWNIFERSLLTTKEYQEILRYIIRDLEPIIKDLKEANQNSQLIFTIPGGLHHGKRNYVFYQPEAKFLEATLHSVLGIASMGLAYAPIEKPIGKWPKQLGRVQVQDEKEREELQSFVDEFNEKLFRLKDVNHMQAAKKAWMEFAFTAKEAFSLTLQSPQMPTNYVPSACSTYLFKKFVLYLEDMLRSLDQGPTELRTLRKPMIDLKKGFENPFNSASENVPDSLVIFEASESQNAEGETTYAMRRVDWNNEILKKWAESFLATPDEINKFKNWRTPEGNKMTSWNAFFPKDERPEDCENESKYYSPVELSNKEIVK